MKHEKDHVPGGILKAKYQKFFYVENKKNWQKLKKAFKVTPVYGTQIEGPHKIL